ncbi:MAG: hypothetical protein AAB656_01960 [Patescibacteria group bacterium]
MKESIDLHVHYDPKDETTAYNALRTAQELGVVAMSLLARGQISDDYNKFVKKGEEMGIKVYPGFECTVILGAERSDLVCLDFKSGESPIMQFYGTKVTSEESRANAARQKLFLEQQGFSFSVAGDEDEKSLMMLMSGCVKERAINFCRIVCKYQENFNLLCQLKMSYSNDWQETVDKYGLMHQGSGLDAKFLYEIFFKEGKPGYIPGAFHEAKTIINATHDSGGIVLYSLEGKIGKNIWEQLLLLGVDGIMGWHGGRLGLDKTFVRQIRNMNLLILGGSDFDPLKNHWQIGVGDGSMYINPRRMRDVDSYIKSIKKMAISVE